MIKSFVLKIICLQFELTWWREDCVVISQIKENSLTTLIIKKNEDLDFIESIRRDKGKNKK